MKTYKIQVATKDGILLGQPITVCADKYAYLIESDFKLIVKEQKEEK